MLGWIQSTFGVSENGAKDLRKAIGMAALKDIAMMLPVGLIYLVLQEMIKSYAGELQGPVKILVYIPMILVMMAFIYFIQYQHYNATYLASYRESANQRIDVAERLRQLPLSFFGMKDLSDLTTRIMGDCATMETAFSHYIPDMIGGIIALIPVAIGMAVMEARMALALLWCVPIAFVIVWATKRVQIKYGRAIKVQKMVYVDSIQECIDNIQDLKATNQSEVYVNGLDEQLATYEKASVKGEIVTGLMVVSAQLVLKLGVVTTVLTGAYLLVAGDINALTYFIFLVAATRMYDPLFTTLQHLAALFNTQLTIERMKELNDHPLQEGMKAFEPKDYTLTFDHVTFGYNAEEPVINDLSFTAKQGQVTALIGPSGGGKSTVAKLAARFYDVNRGHIYFGGVDISTINPEAYLQYFSIVFQDVVLFNNSIMENIRLGKIGASDEEVYEAAKLARCDSFIERLPKGYDTMVGENGGILSGGERQRISIARAILKDAPVILLDEATASLDVENETYVQEAMSTLVENKTVIIIAHRLRTIENADLILTLKGGQIL